MAVKYRVRKLTTAGRSVALAAAGATAMRLLASTGGALAAPRWPGGLGAAGLPVPARPPGVPRSASSIATVAAAIIGTTAAAAIQTQRPCAAGRARGDGLGSSRSP